jgi:hypothetical protein
VRHKKPHVLRCSICGKEVESVSMTAMTKVVDRHRKKHHPEVKGSITYTAVRLNGEYAVGQRGCVQ